MTADGAIRRSGWLTARRTATSIVLILLVYAVIIRPWHLGWGATEAEIDQRMPGDEVLASPDFDATRAIAIAAPPEQVWQVLEPRAQAVVAARGRGRRWERQVEPGRWIVWKDARAEYTWSWQVEGNGSGLTRLVTRQRTSYRWRSPTVVLSLLAEVRDIVALRAALRDVKRQAEQGREAVDSR